MSTSEEIQAVCQEEIDRKTKIVVGKYGDAALYGGQKLRVKRLWPKAFMDWAEATDRADQRAAGEAMVIDEENE